MMDGPRFGGFGFELDPEMEALLREIACNDRARLLRVPRTQAMACLFERNPRVGPFAPGLTSAEVKLLQRYREDLAHLLLRLYFERYLQDAQARLRLCLHVVGKKSYEFLGRARILNRVGTRTVALRTAYPNDSVALELCSAANGATASGLAGAQILAASARLVDSDLARVYTGYELVRADNLRAATHVLFRIHRRTIRPDLTVGALSAFADAQVRLGRPIEARESFARSAKSFPDYPNESLSWLATSLQTGHLHQAKIASAHVDTCLSHSHRIVEDWARSRLMERALGLWSPSRQAILVARSLLEHVGPISRIVLLVFEVPLTQGGVTPARPTRLVAIDAR